MLLSREEISSFIVIRPPFIMVDRLITAMDNYYETSFEVSESNVFVRGQHFSPYGMIENIAQSAAIGLAYSGSSEEAQPLEGFIGAVSKLSVHGLAKPGEKILTKVRLINQLGHMYLFEGICYLGTTKLLDCKVKLSGPKQS